LHRERKNNRAVAGVGIGGTVTFVIREEQLADLAVSESANRAAIAKSADLDLEGLGAAAIREPAAHHGPPPSPRESAAFFKVLKRPIRSPEAS
jgi:hypothetical protein